MGFAPAFLFLAVVGAGAGEARVHRVKVDVRGAVALVEVERTIEMGGRGTEEVVADVSLPEGGALVGWELVEKGKVLAAKAGEVGAVKAAFGTALAARGQTASKVPADESASWRLHLARPAEAVVLRMRYVAPLGCRAGHFVLRVPGTLDVEPVAPEVTVTMAVPEGARIVELTVAGAPVRASGARARARVTGPARAAWEIAFALDESRKGALPTLLSTRASVPGKKSARSESVVGLGICRRAAAATTPLPERVLLLIDRSRSVGAAGIAVERDVARAFLEALPASVRFNAILFDRTAHALFPLARTATKEALATLESQISPGDLQNGTDFHRALELGAQTLRADVAARTWVVIVTDGALPDADDVQSVRASLSRSVPSSMPVLVLLARPTGDEPASPAGQQILRALPAGHGGVLRAIDPADIRAAITEVIASARAGGDLFSLSVADGAHRSELYGALAPEHGATRVLGWPSPARRLKVTGAKAGRTLTQEITPVPVAPEWLTPLRAKSPADAWSVTGPLDAWAEPLVPATAAEPDVTRGEMDKTVLRNTLSLAYMPRARACYLDRRVHTARDLELRGKLRLAIEIERGEVLNASVRNSTLHRPDIESCLREAAFGIEVPRPLHRDAPVLAVLNLQFQPRTPVSGPTDASAFDREIDLLLGPISFPSDPRDLLDEAPAGPR